MKRRDFIALGGGAAAASSLLWPLAAMAQQSGKIQRIGIIDNAPVWDHFRQGLRDHGYVEGRNVILEYRAAEGKPELLAVAAAELARLPVDVIATFGSPASRAAQQATKTIPIVAMSVGDPVRIGLVASLARPGGNITGNTILGPDTVAKRLQLLKEFIPSVSRLAFLWNPDNGSNLAQLEEIKTAVSILNLTLISVEARSPDEFDRAFSAMMRARPDALQMTNDPLHQMHVKTVIEFAARNRLPSMYQTRENVLAGGLISYGPSFPDLFRRGAGYVHRILQGTKPADLPIEQPVTFELIVNMKTAKAIGLSIPESFLARADEVIE